LLAMRSFFVFITMSGPKRLMSHSTSAFRTGVAGSRPHRPRAGRAPGRPRRWDLLLICTAGLFMVAVTRTHVFIPGASAVRPGLLLAGLGLLLWLANNKGIRSLQHLKQPIGYLALFIVVWAGASVPVALYGTYALTYYLTKFASVVLMFLLVAAAVRDIHDVRRFLLLFAIGALIFAFFATTPGVARGIGAGGLDPNDSAMLLVAGILPILYFFLRDRRILVKALLAFGFLICCGAIVASGSRGGFLALLALVVYIVFFYKAVSPTLRLTIVAVLAAGIIGTASGDYWDRMRSITDDDDYNLHEITGRKQLWTRGVGYMFARPVLGVGVNNFAVAEGRHPDIVRMIEGGRGVKYGVAHSMWVEIGAELGIPGFLAFIGLFVLSIRYLYRYTRMARRSRAPPELRRAGEIAATLIGILVALAVGGTFLSQQYNGMIWGVFGLVLGFLKVAPPLKARAPLRRAGNPAATATWEGNRGGRQAADPTLAHPSGQLHGGASAMRDGRGVIRFAALRQTADGIGRADTLGSK
jgi:putative inorganic carbon (hco3(-)) transporter